MPKITLQLNQPNDLATARNGISSIDVDLLTGPWWPDLGLFHTTLGTPDLLITFPPQLIILLFSATHSGLWSVVRGSPTHAPSKNKYKIHLRKIFYINEI